MQQRLAGGWVAEVGYVGSQTTRSRQRLDLQHAAARAGAVQPRRPIPTFGDIRVFDTDGEAEYNGLQLRGQNLDFHGMNVLASYTYSKCIRHPQLTGDEHGRERRIRSRRTRTTGSTASGAAARSTSATSCKFNTVYRLPFGESLTGVARHPRRRLADRRRRQPAQRAGRST